MKRQAIIFMITVLSLTGVPHSVFAIQYGIDFLEPGNPGGWTMSSKTWDSAWAMAVTEEAYVDVWLQDIPEQLLCGAIFIEYNPEQVSIMSVDIYDDHDLPGPWDDNSLKVPDATGPGSYFVFVNGMASPVLSGDIILGRVKFRAEAAGDATITIVVDRDGEFDSVVGWPSATVYDSLIAPTSITIHQTIKPCCTHISPDPLKVFAGKSVQFSANKRGTCNASNYVWSDTCVHAAIDPATGLFTAEAIETEEVCSVCVVDTANPSSCSNAGCSPPADCCAQFTITYDMDDDDVADADDNCPDYPNGPGLGTCIYGPSSGQTCMNNSQCGTNGFCSMNQEDSFPPGGNGIGDACECEGDFNADGNVDGIDAAQFKSDFGRSSIHKPCPHVMP
jgi:hypothetical protein